MASELELIVARLLGQAVGLLEVQRLREGREPDVSANDVRDFMVTLDIDRSNAEDAARRVVRAAHEGGTRPEWLYNAVGLAVWNQADNAHDMRGDEQGMNDYATSFAPELAGELPAAEVVARINPVRVAELASQLVVPGLAVDG